MRRSTTFPQASHFTKHLDTEPYTRQLIQSNRILGYNARIAFLDTGRYLVAELRNGPLSATIAFSMRLLACRD